MDKTPSNVGSVVRNVRLGLNLSLDRAAKMTGVSKAMLGQIERGESSPTVSTLWKIAAGLHITFSRLLGESSEEYKVTGMEDITPVLEADGGMALYNIFPFDPVSGFDYFCIHMKPGCRYESPSHLNVLEECIFVTEGSLEMTINGTVLNLARGQSVKFKGDARHTYANPGDRETVFQNIMKY